MTVSSMKNVRKVKTKQYFVTKKQVATVATVCIAAANRSFNRIGQVAPSSVTNRQTDRQIILCVTPAGLVMWAKNKTLDDI